MLNMNENRLMVNSPIPFFFTATTRHEIEVGFESNCDLQEWKSQGNNG